jgi:hypothetical protein
MSIEIGRNTMNYLPFILNILYNCVCGIASELLDMAARNEVNDAIHRCMYGRLFERFARVHHQGDDESSTNHLNAGLLQRDYTALYPTTQSRLRSSHLLLRTILRR